MVEAMSSSVVKDILRQALVTVGRDCTLTDVVQRMRDAGRGRALVIDPDGRLAGIFTQQDLLHRVPMDTATWGDIPVEQCMTMRPMTVTGTTSLSTTLRLMREGRFRSLPVVDSDGTPSGVVSIRDVLMHLTRNFPQEFLNLPPEPTSEAWRRWGG